MNAAPLRPRLAQSGSARFFADRGFTLAEIAVVTLIISILAALAVPYFKQSIISARSDTLINDLRVFTQAFQAHLQEKGDWPAEQADPGQLPTGMDGYLRQSNWERVSPIGGYYNWDNQQRHNGLKLQAVIAICTVGEIKVTSDRIQLEDIDRKLDDGNLSTGNFRLGFRNEPIYIIEP